jgi:membrane dipeptidase
LKSIPVFDGHNDVLLRLWLKKNKSAAQHFIQGDGLGHIDLPRLQNGGFIGGLFAVFSPASDDDLPDDDDLNPPLAGQLSRSSAVKSSQAMLGILDEIVELSDGSVRICQTVAEIREAHAAGVIATVIHIEGAEAISANLGELDDLYARGLRSLGPVWSRPNVFGHGVPFRFPSSPDTGPGLTEAGKALVKACNAKRILVDVSHLNEEGFWDVNRITNAPLVASHSNAHSVAASSRNLTDDQIRAIGESSGLIGVNFATGFIRPDGAWNRNTPAEMMLRHFDHLLKLAGEDCVGFGSDFDGARVPNFISDAGGVPKLIESMAAHGYGDQLIRKIAGENWLRVLDKTWGG